MNFVIISRCGFSPAVSVRTTVLVVPDGRGNLKALSPWPSHDQYPLFFNHGTKVVI